VLPHQTSDKHTNPCNVSRAVPFLFNICVFCTVLHCCGTLSYLTLPIGWCHALRYGTTLRYATLRYATPCYYSTLCHAMLCSATAPPPMEFDLRCSKLQRRCMLADASQAAMAISICATSSDSQSIIYIYINPCLCISESNFKR